jgi:hypothetical protein
MIISSLLKVQQQRSRFGSRAADQHPIVGLALLFGEDEVTVIGDSSEHAGLTAAANALETRIGCVDPALE